jgi:predicted O-linked N-acetylglucosamine transferase (SPINDLY family)/MoaA/NifB/PqqE/SkfB family radical SAM enzyme
VAQDVPVQVFAEPQRLNRLQIEITTGCNLGCAGCQRTIGIEAGTWRNANMKLPLFEAVIGNAPPAQALVLQGIGEPTLHNDLGAMIRRAKATGKYPVISFNTNALVRPLSFYREMAAAGLNHVSVSIDSLDPERAERLRARTDVDQLAAMTSALVSIFPGLTASIVLSTVNLGELGDLLATIHDLGVRFIEIQPLISYAAASDPICLDAAGVATARRVLAETVARRPGLALLPAAALTPNGSRCRRPLRAAYVTVDGFLTPCCTTNDVDLYGRISLAEMPFSEAWRRPGVARWLGDFYDRDHAICAGCAFNPAGQAAAVAAPPPAAAATPVSVPAPIAAPAAPVAAPSSAEPARPTLAEAIALQTAGDADAAAAAFAALVGGADGAEALHRLGLLALGKGEGAKAVALIDAAAALAPSARLKHNAAVALNQSGDRAGAVARLKTIAAEHPEYATAQFSLAAFLSEAGETQAAADLMGTLADRANEANATGVLDGALGQLGRLEAAPANLMVLANRLRVAGRGEATRRLLAPLIARHPDHVGARLTNAMAALTVVHADGDEMARRRATYVAEMTALADTVAGLPTDALKPSVGVIGAAKPFFLSYHGEDDRALQEIYGGILARLNDARGRIALPPPARDGRLRIGFVSFYFTLHSVSKLFAGWMKHLDRDRFEVIGYHIGAGEDATSRAIQATADRWRAGQRPAADWVATIAADAPHVLVYLELGMNGTAVELACNRLAPVQCMTWGHPVTSGLPDIDYFLSSDLMEPADGDRHYRETLVRLPNLSIAYEPLDVKAGGMTRAEVGLRPSATVYVCCQSLFKYRPQEDHLLVALARAVPDSQFLFIGAAEAPPTKIFRARLEAAFRAGNLDPARHLVVTPPVPFERFGALIGLGDVYLDSIAWSGGNTTLEAVTLGLPVVTLPTGLMRGRHTLAILTRMGLDATIARDGADFVAIAARLADPAERATARALIAERRPLLFGDLTPVRALETFLEDAVARASAPPPGTVAAAE